MLRLNRKTVLLFLFIISLASGQSERVRNSPDNTFKNAVSQYNRGAYLETIKIIDNLHHSEKSFYDEEIDLLRMKAEYRLHNYIEVRNVGRAYLNKYPVGKYTNDVLTIFGDVYLSEGNYESAYRTFIKALRGNVEKKNVEQLENRIFTTLQYGINKNVLNELLLIESNTNIINILWMSKAHIDLTNGLIQSASEVLNGINRRDLSGTGKKYYDQLIDKTEQTDKNAIIPVILPLSGKNSKIGNEFLEGLEFAQSQSSTRGLNLSFIVYDNKSDPIKTLGIFNKINKNPNTTAVLGPIDYNNSIIAGSFSMQKGYPILLPDVTIGALADMSDNIFLMNSNLKLRGRLAAKFVAEKLHAENIAILAPADRNGKILVEAFENELGLYNLSASVVEWYAGLPISLERQFKSIRSQAWEIQALADTTESTDSTFIFSESLFADSTFILETDFESDSLHSYSALIDSLLAVFKSEEELMTKEDSAKVVLETIDAIYMPINEDDLDYVGAQFPAYNLKTTIVGNDNWTDLNILRKENIGTHIKGLTIISNYAYYNINQLNDRLNEKRSKYFYEAVDAYDILVDAFIELDDSDRTMKQVLYDIEQFDGIFGSYTFFGGNNANSNLRIMQFDGYRFKEIESNNTQNLY